MVQTPDQQVAFFTQSGALLKLVVLSLLLERGLAFIFEHDWFVRLASRKVGERAGVEIRESRPSGIKATLALAAAVLICFQFQFDALGAVFSSGPSTLGMIATALVAAGGSAGAIKLFQGFLGLNKDARDSLIEAKRAESEAAKLVAEANAARAQAEADAAESVARRVKQEEVASAAVLESQTRALAATGARAPNGDGRAVVKVVATL